MASPDRSPGASSPSERSKTAPISSSARTACGLRNLSLLASPLRSNLDVKNIRLRTCWAGRIAAPAIEIPDSRFENFATVGEAQLIADNACAHEFILGSATEADWRAIDLSQHKATIEAVGGFTTASVRMSSAIHGTPCFGSSRK